MEASEFILLLLSSKPDGIDGRTAFQKLGYFATIILEKDFGYSADYYGPYSPLLAASLQNLVESDFVNERGQVTSHNRRMYSYDLNDEAVVLAKLVKRKYRKEFRAIKNVVKKCDDIINCDYNVLSWAAKVHYVLEKNHKSMTYQEAIAACKPFGWKLGENEIDTAAKLLKELHLVAK